ncbi:MAG TPA: RecX family transcriptional regulator [Sphingomicrobium sp.]
MAFSKRRRPPAPLDEQKLGELALRYVGRFATTRAKLRSYLQRKVRERGWDGVRAPDVEAVAERLAELGYVDDAGYALAKSRSLSGRGYGKRRLGEALRVAGIDETDGAAAVALAEAEAVSAALRFAERRRLGPFAARTAEPRDAQKALAAMVRAGHDIALARAIVHMAPGADIDADELRLVLQ